MKHNVAMRNLLRAAVLPVSLKPTLSAIVSCGFDVREDCYFLAALLTVATNVTKSNFQDCTGYECFVNSVHVEDHDGDAPLGQALEFVSRVFALWSASTSILILSSIVSVDEFSVVVKFHVKRPAEQWLSDNLEGYEDPVLSLESSEDLTEVFPSLRHRR
jgi:hypothetical protein